MSGLYVDTVTIVLNASPTKARKDTFTLQSAHCFYNADFVILPCTSSDTLT